MALTRLNFSKSDGFRCVPRSMAVRISHVRTPGPGAGGKEGGGGGGWTASERASNEQIRPLSAAHGPQSDKDTLQTGNLDPSNEEAHTNGPTKCDRGLNCARMAPPPHPTPLYPAQEGHGQTLPP